MKVQKWLLLSHLCIALLLSTTAHAQFELTHIEGPSGFMPNGMQAVHTETHIIYANPGDVLRMYRPDRCAFTGYIRWYCYDTDRAAARIVTTRNDNYTLQNNYGWFRYSLGRRVTDKNSNYFEVDYTMHAGDSTYRVANDQSIHTDFLPGLNWSNSRPLTEPTLSKRLIYEMHPATEMAARMDTCIGDGYLEVHHMFAPTKRQLYIGPDYRFMEKTIGADSYSYLSRSNYYFNAAAPERMSDNEKWVWSIDGVASSFTDVSAQFIAASSLTAGTHTYTLQYNTGTQVYNVAKFIVVYMDVNTVGPLANLTKPTNMNLIYENTFNYDQPGVRGVRFWSGHLGVDESTYGYYFLDKKKARCHHPDEPNWSEYGIVNAQDSWNAPKDSIFNHNDSVPNNTNNAKLGYMIFVDGSQQPGQVFNLSVNADLCPGAKMYFSAWLIDASNSSGSVCAPNMDFIVVGVDELGNEHHLATYTTGEFGINAKDLSTNQKLKRAEWNQILFPVEIDANAIYQTYKLRIMNKGKSSDGNDFAIDDIRIYVQKPPVVPIQASTYDCPAGTMDSITAYLRVDYQAIDESSSTFYYQWRDYNNDPMETAYFNSTGSSSIRGSVQIPASEEAIIASGDTCSSLLSFDAKYYNTEVPVVKYVKERVDAAVERYIMYIAQPLVVRTNHTYNGFVSIREEDLGDKSGCGTFAELMIAGGTRITIDGEAKGDSVVDICGNRSYTLDIELTYISQNTITGELEEHTTPCRADWLIGDSTYVNANPEVYHYSFRQIEAAIEDYRTNDPLEISRTIVNYLLHQGLLVLDTVTTTMQPSISLSYTAFPVNGSAENGMSVCLTPRFLHIHPSTQTTNMMMVGDETENLPAAIADRPRVMRISNAKKAQGEFFLKTYVKGDEGVQYKVDTVILVSSTCPSWTPVGLSASSANELMSAEDSIRIYGPALATLEPGYDYTFHVQFKDEDEGCERGFTYFTLRIVPDEVTWYGGDWNTDASWSSFVPMPETNVVLQPNKDYNVTFSTTDSIYDLNYTRSQCDNIYLPDDASLAGQEKIQIHGKVFIDIKEYAWKWTLTSIPIHGVVSGDFFVSASESSLPFVVAPINQTVGEPSDDRSIFEVYLSEYNAASDKWKTATKSMTTPFVPGSASMVGIDCESDDVNPLIRLPKHDDMYHYYERKKQVWMAEAEYITRDANYGKPVYSGQNQLTLKEIYENVYLFGNPTLAYVDITKLVEDNSDKLTGRYYLEATGTASAPKKQEMTTFNSDVNTDEYHVLLPPYRGILLEGKAASQEITINVSSPLINPMGRNPLRRIQPASEEEVTTGIETPNNTTDIRIIYDIFGRLMGHDLNNLPDGVYIIREGSVSRKVLIKK